MDDKIKVLQEWIDESNHIVFFSGASMSTDIPDLYRMEASYFKTYDYPPQTIYSRSFLERKPDAFFRFYRERVLKPLLTADPNIAHRKLVELEHANKLRMILTQNTNELHQEAGSRKVMELHGSVMRNKCPLCDTFRSALDIYEYPGIPYCTVDMCGAVISPDIILYGDALNREQMAEAIYQVLMADLLIVAGSSLLEYPAAALVPYYSRKKLVLIHESESILDERANLIIRAPICDIMEQINIAPTTGQNG
ncbi:MAG: Sir2 family NAD-dependent protein deacetylase [Evtepia sp.]